MVERQEVKLGQIGQIAVHVSDVEKAALFYRDVLGLKLLFQIPNMAFFDCDGIRLMLTPPGSPEFEQPGSVIYFRTDDIEGAHHQLMERGVTFKDKPHLIADMGDHELWMTFFDDPDQNHFALMSEIPKK